MNRSRRPKQNKNYKLANPASDLTLRTTVPDTIHVPLSYHTRIALSGAVQSDQTFNLNSLFDPDRAGVGHQPLGFDQWSSFYQRYRVDKAVIDITAVNNSATSVAEVVLQASNDPTLITTQAMHDSACESAFSTVTLLPTAGGMNVKKWRRTYYPNQITGVTPQRYRNDDTYAALITASPSEIIVLHCEASDVTFSNNISVFLDVKLTYYATFYDRLQLAQS